jgi:alanyl-tRNA synthetase
MFEMKLQQESVSADEIGQQFLAYYARLGYEILPGSSLLNDSVPMSFVMSAGMAQFESLSGQKRSGDHFVLIQNCFRYFDLEQIGVSKTHLSLFQMPGAFDFGPVERQRAISQIWDLLINTYAFDPGSLAVTYFGGDTIDGQTLPPDTETAAAWRAVGMPEEQIFGLPAEHNFWSQNARAVGRRNSRKRGPNTEVFWDRGAEYACGPHCIPSCSCGRYIEFLNALFITLRIDEETRQLTPLKEPFTEIVIGLERAAFLLQGKDSVFEIDSMDALVQQLRCFSKPLPMEIEGLDPNKFERLLVDHLRALLFLIADGAPPPGRGGRARLMRILVRELLTSQRLLGISDPGFMRSMILSALELYPQLAPARRPLLEYLAKEGDVFERTVQVGMYDLEAILGQGNGQIGGADILALEKKHGLPLPLLKYRLWQKNIAFQHEEYEAARSQLSQKAQATKPASAPFKSIQGWKKTDEIMQVFLEHYRALGYQRIAGGSLLDDSIPMSFVMSAGLAQVERSMARTMEQGRNRFVLLQNCFRHFDLDKIGQSKTHLSFFRMLGAFCIGAVDRQEQIEGAWNLARQAYQLPPEKLWATYFGGGTIEGRPFEPDLETYRVWRSLGISTDHLLGLDGESNFWKQSAMLMGAEHAPKCGPNSEIFFDRGLELSCGPDCRPGCACGRFVEFFNMLFITWSIDEKTDQVRALENPFTETVIGVERLAMILQGAASVYEIESIQPLMLQIQQSVTTSNLEEQERVHYERILADHLRALLFLVADGAPPPGKGGRAFLMRRLAREVLVSLALLGLEGSNFLPAMIEQALALHQESLPAGKPVRVILSSYIDSEKSKFEHTLKSGFERIERRLARENLHWMSGQDVTCFEKEYGLPLPMLARFLAERGITYHPEAYQAARELRNLEALESQARPALMIAKGTK